MPLDPDEKELRRAKRLDKGRRRNVHHRPKIRPIPKNELNRKDVIESRRRKRFEKQIVSIEMDAEQDQELIDEDHQQID